MLVEAARRAFYAAFRRGSFDHGCVIYSSRGLSMATDRDGALLAHIADTVTELREQQGTMIAILGQLTDAIGAQTEMLTEVLGAAREEPGPSETAQALTALAAAVEQNTAAVTSMGDQLAALPREIATEVAHAMGEEPPEEG